MDEKEHTLWDDLNQGEKEMVERTIIGFNPKTPDYVLLFDVQDGYRCAKCFEITFNYLCFMKNRK